MVVGQKMPGSASRAACSLFGYSPSAPSAGPSRLVSPVASQKRCSRRHASSNAAVSRPLPPLPNEPWRRRASTQSVDTDWLSWMKKGAVFAGSSGSGRRKALLFAGLGSYPHTPNSPTASSLQVWEEASEALLNPDMTIGYETRGMEEFAGALSNSRGDSGVRGWMRGWVEGRSLDELMRRPDVTAAFILTSSIAILASQQELSGTSTLLPKGTTHLCGHGFIGTLTALVANGRLDLATGVRLARLYASLPPSPPSTNPRRFQTTVLSARYFHSLSSPSMFVPFEDPLADLSGSSEPQKRRRAMQMILDEIHGLQDHWRREMAEGEEGEWAAPGIINSSKVLVVTGTQFAVHQVVERLQQLNLANPVMDVKMPCPYNTRLMDHAIPSFRAYLSRSHFVDQPVAENTPVVMDPMTTYELMGNPARALLPSLTNQVRWHKTLTRLYTTPAPAVDSFMTVGRGARGLGVMLRGELKKRDSGAPDIAVEEFGVRDVEIRGRKTSIAPM